MAPTPCPASSRPRRNPRRVRPATRLPRPP
jgi:hypothetical protein